MSSHDLPEYHLLKDQSEIIQKEHFRQGAMLEESVRKYNFDNPKNHKCVMADRPLAGSLVVPRASMYNMTFWPYSDSGYAESICFAAYYILIDYDAESYQIPFIEWVREVRNKGYMSWKFKNYPEIFTSPEIDIEEVKTRFSGKADITDCRTEQELVEKLGPVKICHGIEFLLDVIIAHLNERNFRMKTKPVIDTRLTSVKHILQNLSNNAYVPLYVRDDVYHKAPKRSGGHCVILYGVKGDLAYVWDSNSETGYVEIPFKTLMTAAIRDKGLISAWELG